MEKSTKAPGNMENIIDESFDPLAFLIFELETKIHEHSIYLHTDKHIGEKYK